MKLVVALTMIIHQKVYIIGTELKLLTLNGELQRKAKSFSIYYEVQEFLLQ